MNSLQRYDIFPIITHYEDPYIIDLITDLNIKYCYVSTSYYLNYRYLVNSMLPVLESAGIKIIPSLVHMLAYENKSLQVIYAKANMLPMPRAFAIATVESYRRAAKALGFPVVVKSPDGFGSTAVSLLTSDAELEQFAEEFAEKAVGTQGLGRYIVQEFVPNLDGDWKVILVGNAGAVLFRGVRPGDFRASGSGLFEFREAPAGLLDLPQEFGKSSWCRVYLAIYCMYGLWVCIA
jgi:glutathione synthase/RimK-type ligase-like ATP-grasp enzyme